MTNDARGMQKKPNLEEVSGFLGSSLDPNIEPTRSLPIRTHGFTSRNPSAPETNRSNVPRGDSLARQRTSVCDSQNNEEHRDDLWASMIRQWRYVGK
jgi:hypothetical protein